MNAEVWDDEDDSIALTREGIPYGEGKLVRAPLLEPDEARELAFDLLETAAAADEDGADLDDMRTLERRAFAMHGEAGAVSAQFEEHPDEDVSQGRLMVYYDLDELRGEDE